MKKRKKKIKLASLFTALIFLFELFSPVFYEMVQAELYMSVSGSVVGGAGFPVDEAQVTIFKTENGRVTQQFYFTKTNNKGKYFLDMVPPGEFYLFVSPPQNSDFGVSTEPMKIQVTRGRNLTNVVIVLQRGGSVNGVVYESDGVTPMADVQVVAKSDVSSGISISDRNGFYKIDKLISGNYSLTPFKEGRVTSLIANVTVDDGKVTSLDFKLPATVGTRISGKVSDNDGHPVNGAFVLISGMAHGGIARTDKNGSYEISGFEKGTYDILILAQKFKIKVVKRAFNDVSEEFDTTLDPKPIKSSYNFDSLNLKTIENFIVKPAFALSNEICTQVCLETQPAPLLCQFGIPCDIIAVTIIAIAGLPLLPWLLAALILICATCGSEFCHCIDCFTNCCESGDPTDQGNGFVICGTLNTCNPFQYF